MGSQESHDAVFPFTLNIRERQAPQAEQMDASDTLGPERKATRASDAEFLHVRRAPEKVAERSEVTATSIGTPLAPIQRPVNRFE